MSDIDVGQISEALNNKVDLDCDNINTDGEKHFDGQWVPKYMQCTQLTSSVTAIGNYSYDISDYLPDSVNSYEVICRLYASDDHTSSVTNAWTVVGTSANPYDQINNDGLGFTTNGLLCCVTDTYADKAVALGLLNFIGNNRTLYLQIAERALENGCSIYLYAYRRIGVNQ